MERTNVTTLVELVDCIIVLSFVRKYDSNIDILIEISLDKSIYRKLECSI